MSKLNLYNKKLETCSTNPLTGAYRNGCCETGPNDIGTHTVCAIMTNEFLSFSASRGNDLITPAPHHQFPGLKAGDKWCLCVSRWIEAEKANKAPKLILEATHEKTLEYTSLDVLVKHAFIKP